MVKSIIVVFKGDDSIDFMKKLLNLFVNVSNVLAQGIDTVIFMTVAFWSTRVSIHDNALFLMGIILPYWTIKCLCSLLETPLVYVGVHWLRQGK